MKCTKSIGIDCIGFVGWFVGWLVGLDPANSDDKDDTVPFHGGGSAVL